MKILISLILLLYVVLSVFLIWGNIDFTTYVWTEKEPGTDRDYMRTLNVFVWVVVPLSALYAFFGVLYAVIWDQDIVSAGEKKTST